MSFPTALADELVLDPFLTDPADDDLSAISYDNILHIVRRWLWPGVIPVGGPVILAAAGGTGKGLMMAASAARVALGLPFPGEDQSLRREPRCVVWITSVGEDDPHEDLAPRLRAAIAVAVAEFGLDPALNGPDGAIRNIYDLSSWQGGAPVTLPADCGRVVAEVANVNASNERKGRPPVALIVADSLSALLSEGYSIDYRQKARRVMAMLSACAKEADTALVLIHHLTQDGKVAGSPAVLAALRVAFKIERVKDNENLRVLVLEKANISTASPVRYSIEGEGAATHAQFSMATDPRLAVIREAQRRALPASPRAVTSAPGALAAPEPGPYALMRVTQASGTTPCEELLGGPYASRALATAAADRDAGAVLSWQDRGRLHVAATSRADGTRVSYGVALASLVPAPV